MNDFLHSLRSNKDKRFERNRRNYDSPGYRGNERVNNVDRKRKGTYRPQQNEQAQAYAAINKLLPTIKTLLESLTEDRKRLIEAEERKAVAMETIAAFLKQISRTSGGEIPVFESIESICEDDSCEPLTEETAEVLSDDDTFDTAMADQEDEAEDASVFDDERTKTEQREELIAMVQDLRDQGFSYEKIARHLEDNNIPTISGRGRWRGQAVSKLCQ